MRNNKIRMLSGIGSVVVLLLMTGCQTAPKDERSAGVALDDKHITANVQKSLEQEPTYKFNTVEVSTFDGMVQLSGFVDTEGQKTRAQEVAQNVGGVRVVVNGISLKPVMQPTGRTSSEQRAYSDQQNTTTAPGQAK